MNSVTPDMFLSFIYLDLVLLVVGSGKKMIEGVGLGACGAGEEGTYSRQ